MFTLGKQERLKSRKLIEQLFKEGKTFAVNSFRVYYSFANDRTSLEAGFGVSSKHFKKAVDRNRIKRLMREGYRVQKTQLQNRLVERRVFLYLFLIYTGRDLPEQKFVSEKIAVILERLALTIHEKFSASA